MDMEWRKFVWLVIVNILLILIKRNVVLMKCEKRNEILVIKYYYHLIEECSTYLIAMVLFFLSSTFVTGHFWPVIYYFSSGTDWFPTQTSNTSLLTWYRYNPLCSPHTFLHSKYVYPHLTHLEINTNATDCHILLCIIFFSFYFHLIRDQEIIVR